MSLSVTDAVAILLRKQDDYRKAVLSSPKDKSEYGYGEAVGTNNGLQLAINALTAAIKEDGEELRETD